MQTLHQLKSGLSEAWEALSEGWQRLYRRAAGAITRFTPRPDDATTDTDGGHQELLTRNSGWGVLAAEVYDDDERIVVRLELPGLTREDIDLQVLGQYLAIRGEKHLEREHSAGQYHITECAYGRFERLIPLPDAVDAGRASARYRHGVLRVELPRAAGRQRRRIQIDND